MALCHLKSLQTEPNFIWVEINWLDSNISTGSNILSNNFVIFWIRKFFDKKRAVNNWLFVDFFVYLFICWFFRLFVDFLFICLFVDFFLLVRGSLRLFVYLFICRFQKKVCGGGSSFVKHPKRILERKSDCDFFSEFSRFFNL